MATPPVAAPDPSPAQLRLEALKLLKDWSVWMVTVEVAGIGWLLAKTDPCLPLNMGFKKLTVVTFACSAAFAAWVLSGIVSLAQRVNSDQSLDKAGIYDLTGIRKIRFGWITVLQHVFFLLGIAFFIAAVIKG
jgi:hypothetical protein